MSGGYDEIPFPPRSAQDVYDYDHAEVFDGFLDFDKDDPLPGSNRSPAYRWGWQNSLRDRQSKDDGYDAIRHDYIKFKMERDGTLRPCLPLTSR